MIDLRKIDALIADRVMGWHVHNAAWFDEDNHYREDVRDYRPSLNIEDAFEILDQFDCFSISRLKSGVRGGSTYAAFIQSEINSKYADTAPLAICLAALAWKGVEVSD